MGADCLESTEVESGHCQEGVFGGASAFIQKLGTSVALLPIGWALEFSGYRPGASEQTTSALTTMRVMVSWVPAILLPGTVWAAAAFPITREVHRRLAPRSDGRRRLGCTREPTGTLPGQEMGFTRRADATM